MYERHFSELRDEDMLPSEAPSPAKTDRKTRCVILFWLVAQPEVIFRRESLWMAHSALATGSNADVTKISAKNRQPRHGEDLEIGARRPTNTLD